jgi:hypothetical protein
MPHTRELRLDDDDRSGLERAIAGALRATIHDHGPITSDKIGSAVKRVIGSLANTGFDRSPSTTRRATGRSPKP